MDDADETKVRALGLTFLMIYEMMIDDSMLPLLMLAISSLIFGSMMSPITYALLLIETSGLENGTRLRRNMA